MNQHRTAVRFLTGLALASGLVLGMGVPAQAADTGWNGTKSQGTSSFRDTGWNGTKSQPAATLRDTGWNGTKVVQTTGDTGWNGTGTTT